MSHLFQKKNTAVNHVWWPSKLYPKNNVYRVNVQLRTRYTGPDAAYRQKWGLLEARKASGSEQCSPVMRDQHKKRGKSGPVT